MPISQQHYHAVQFYKDVQSLGATVARFLAEGLSAGQPALIVATGPHVHSISTELTRLGIDVPARRVTGELQALDARKLLNAIMVGDRPDALMFKSNVGNAIEKLCVGRRPCPIRVYGEVVDVLWRGGNTDGAIRLEVLWNQLASAYEFQLLCGYAIGHFQKENGESADIEDVCRQHSHVVQPA